MLKKKLKLEDTPPPEAAPNKSPQKGGGKDFVTSKHFSNPFWKSFFDIECDLNDELKAVKFESRIEYTLNPIVYARFLHCEYLKKFLDGRKTVLFVGMNPGPNGMAQTGVPFGNIKTVRDWMKLEGEVEQPEKCHPKRPINGLQCTIDEPSGHRIWTVLLELSGGLETFSKQCFVHNFCPLVFYDKAGKNITPSELRGDAKKQIKDICLKYLEKEINLVSPQIIIPIGNYVKDCLKSFEKTHPDTKILQLVHPSPRSLNNTNWPEKAKKFFETNDLLKYLKNTL